MDISPKPKFNGYCKFRNKKKVLENEIPIPLHQECNKDANPQAHSLTSNPLISVQSVYRQNESEKQITMTVQVICMS